MTGTKKSESKSESKSDTSAEAAPEAAPGGASDVDAIRQASGEAVKDESGSQEDWRERHAEGEGEGA
jgi:hypothetical protein